MTAERSINPPEITSRKRWREARERLLTKEKEATRARDALNAERRRLPMVEIGEGLAVDEWEQPFDLHGHSCFLRHDGRVFHTYSTYARGAESVGGSYYWLDMTALGRQEDREEPEDRVTSGRGAAPEFDEALDQ